MTQEGLPAAARGLGLFKMADLDADLQDELARCDAVVYMVPTTERRLGLKQLLKDQVDALGAAVLFETGRSRAFWRSAFDKGIYGRGFSPAPRLFDLQGWQEWELRMARELGLLVVKVRIGDEPSDEDAAQDDELVTCRPERLEQDVAEKVLPRVRSASRPDPELAGLLPMFGAAALGFLAMMVMAVLTAFAVAAYFVARAAI